MFGRKKSIPVSPPDDFVNEVVEAVNEPIVQAPPVTPIVQEQPVVEPQQIETPVKEQPEELTEEQVKAHLSYIHDQIAKIKDHLNLSAFD